MTNYCHDLKIPKERIAVLIGTEGQTRDLIEKNTDTKITVNSHEGDVHVEGADAIRLFTSREIIKAIGRGFNPEIALQLNKSDYCFELISIMDFAKTKKDVIRLKGRVIGSEGKSRKAIETLCEVSISVYGKTVGIIGEAQRVGIARRAIESLLSGSPHANVYKWLEKQRRDIKKIELLGPALFKEEFKE